MSGTYFTHFCEAMGKNTFANNNNMLTSVINASVTCLGQAGQQWDIVCFVPTISLGQTGHTP